MNKVLFVLKRKEDYNIVRDSKLGLSTGLYNSASFVNNMLNEAGISSIMEVVVDNNEIDRVVTLHRPKYVIIEALWVVPSKFKVLQQLHPNVTWIIRLHSEIPFIAGEGVAMDWVGEYGSFKNVIIAVNSPRMYNDITNFFIHLYGYNKYSVADKVIRLYNYYPETFKKYSVIDKKTDIINIGCFGAIRPLKNHLIQAISAIRFAESIGKKLYFHVNVGRIEGNAGSHFKNLTSLFEHLYNSGHQLILHEWKDRQEFLELCSKMDIGMQVSFSETFNIVGADIISQGVPLVSCKELPWAVVGLSNPTDSEDIVDTLLSVYNFPKINVWLNQQGLSKYINNTRKQWVNYFKK